ncbi:MAG: zinc-binding alcohol dehydrogenase, partial [Planctomycetes bacterium]|nr:zinc-binding alcohol dehydrogenase [Planctomycetota bacterium]
MKQLLQHIRSGETEIAEIPCPRSKAKHLLIQTRASLISAGTERMLIEFSRASLVSKARQNPDRVRQVLDKIKADGLLPTMEAVFARLEEPIPLGYCNAGVVLEVGAGVTAFRVGDRVASNGSHAEMVNVPVNLCAKIPDGVGDEQAAFTVVGSIGLQGIRLIQPTLGESVAVFGLGLIGLVAVQLLRASGCRVLGIDKNADRLRLGEQFGAEVVDVSGDADPVAAAAAVSNGQGVDAVLITASAKGNAIVRQAAQMSRKRGRIVLVGVVGLELERADFYEKELSFQVSCSYGPGRYDPAYEQQGQDYPYGYVRWTQQRNLGAVLDMMATGRLDVGPLITNRIPLTDAGQAYDTLMKDTSAIGIVLDYPKSEPPRGQTVTLRSGAKRGEDGRVVIGLI